MKKMNGVFTCCTLLTLLERLLAGLLLLCIVFFHFFNPGFPRLSQEVMMQMNLLELILKLQQKETVSGSLP